MSARQRLDFLLRGPGNPRDRRGAVEELCGIHDLGAGLLVAFVEEAGCGPRAAFDAYLEARRAELGNRLGNGAPCGDARRSRLPRNRYWTAPRRLIGGPRGFVQPRWDG